MTGFEGISATNLSYGEVEHCSVSNLFEFNDVIKTLSQHQCLVYGLCDSPQAKVVSRRALSYEQRNNPGQPVVTRTLDDFSWGINPGIWFIDYDPKNKFDALNMEGLRHNLILAIPELAKVPMLIRHSSSSFINKTTGEVVYAEGGKRVYIPVDKPAEIQTLSQLLFDRCWLSGSGWHKISKDGKLLERGLNDLAVCSPERIDYAALPKLGEGLEFAKEKAEFQVWYDGKLIDKEEDLKDVKKFFMSFQDVKPLTKTELSKVAAKKKENEDRLREAADTQHQHWLVEQADEIEERTGCDYETGRKIAEKAHLTQILPDEWLLHFTSISGSLSKTTKVTVKQVKAKPDEFVGLTLLDPIEPEYGNYKVVAKCVDSPQGLKIISQAHGGKDRTWLLVDEDALMTYTFNGETFDLPLTLNEVAGYLAKDDTGDGDLLKHIIGNKLVCIEEIKNKCARWNGNLWEFKDYGNKYLLAETLHSIYNPHLDVLIHLLPRNVQRDARKRVESLWKNEGKEAVIKSYTDVCSVSVTEFDKNKFLLPFTNGVYDLKTNTFRPSVPEDYMSKQVAYAYDPSATCERWLAFLDLILQGDQAVIRFLQIWFGVCLSGTFSDNFLFFYGGGHNGKSTVVEVIAKLLGSFSASLDSSLLFGKCQTPDYEKAKLKGARFVTTTEFQNNITFNSGIIKSLVGGDTITARPIFSNPISFEATHKMVLSGNNLPKITDASLGMRRRIIKVPFFYQIPFTERRDKNIVIEEFCEDGSGILNWLLEGWKAYCANNGRIETPKSLQDSTDDYIKENTEQPPELEFLDDMVESGVLVVDKNDHQLKMSTEALASLYDEWARKKHKQNLTITYFIKRLREKHGFVKKRVSRKMLIFGIGKQSCSLSELDDGEILKHFKTNTADRFGVC